MSQFNKAQAHSYILNTYKEAELEQLLCVKKFYKVQVKDRNIQKVQYWFCEKLSELITKRKKE